MVKSARLPVACDAWATARIPTNTDRSKRTMHQTIMKNVFSSSSPNGEEFDKDEKLCYPRGKCTNIVNDFTNIPWQTQLQVRIPSLQIRVIKE